MYRFALSAFVVLTVLSLDKPALAYLDPGTGSMLLQLLLGGVAGAMVVGKLYWQRIKDLFSGGQRTAGAGTPRDSKQSDRGPR